MTNSISEGKEKAGMKMTDRIENSLSGLSTLDRKKKSKHCLPVSSLEYENSLGSHT